VKRAEAVGLLFDHLAERPDGATKHDIAGGLGVRSDAVCGLVQGLRDVLADTDTINVSCDRDPSDPTGPWRYRLVGTVEEITAWQGNRVGDTERRLRTMLHVVIPIANGSDPASVEGRKARIMRKTFARCLEDLDEIRQGP